MPSDQDPCRPRPRFILTKHHARTLHWDLRLESAGTLLSWALPKGEPDEPGTKRLAVRTEDHSVDFLDPTTTTARAAAGGSSVVLKDMGDYEAETWLPEFRIVVVLHGELLSTRRLALIRTSWAGREDGWLAQRLSTGTSRSNRPV